MNRNKMEIGLSVIWTFKICYAGYKFKFKNINKVDNRIEISL
jgi:hypothetical protein